VAGHDAFDRLSTELGRFLNRVAGAFTRRCHAGHDLAAALVVVVGVFNHCALTAGADRTHAGVPAEVGQILFMGQDLLQQVVVGVNFEDLAINSNLGHFYSA
jgi:hypothetical protein